MNSLNEQTPSHLRRLAGTALLSALVLVGCSDDNPVDPTSLPDLSIATSATAFAATDPFIGTDETVVIALSNQGGGDLNLTGLALSGSHAADFMIVSGGEAGVIAAGATREVVIGFAPSAAGTSAATLTVTSNDPSMATTEVNLTGTAQRFRYTQVDRVGIPTLNTVFNHPSGTAGFDKKAYNIAAPSSDVATYTGQFMTVLGAVGNANPAATAALLLPDELPVNLGASTTAFAQLTGRALSDDAVDVALIVTVGVPSLQSDNVSANDKQFRTQFPYVAAANN